MSSPPNRPAHSVFFPVAPAGVTIIPFSQFIEHGIRAIDGEDGIERDGLGIPTISLRVTHDTDVSKTNPERPKKTAKEMRAARPAFRREWWEDWNEGEDLRNHGPYDANAAPVDRFHQAASDFHKYRKFPPLSTNVQWLWDQFRIFAGLLGTTPVWHRASDKLADDEDEDEVSDDDFEDQSQNRGGDRKFHRLRPRAPYELYGKKAVVVQDDVEIRGLLDAARAEKDAKAAHFLQDPARGIQIFLSSYMKNEGIIWSDRNLVNAPHLLRFFVNYLLRNHVLPDEASERSLRAALVTIDIAATELPMTSKISKAIPDDFSRACQGFVGRFLDEFSDDEGEPNPKRVKPNPDDTTFESVLEKENVVLINKEDVLPADDDPSTVDVSNEWDSPGAPSEDAWAPAAPPSLLPMVGQVGALLPDTHTSGVVESSVRRITAIYPPSPVAGNASDAESVQCALEEKLHRLIFAPWINWAGVPDGPSPPVLFEPKMVRDPRGEPHDMRTDDITVLVSAQTAGMLCVGMGLGGTWVELVSKGAPEDEKKERYWYLDEMTMVLPSYWLVLGPSSD
ncbi:hypothetical protein FB45DRAFT_214560 [Roridomyces roridus]|uniref:Uncharacterized protein n=1 Tax=Roridomyces roridus TaxID=1738132 RepID=A0AAD7BDF1_9AGAR|nr:hypothetical protein FB45DRAFT_214560 [Roridomyces roridus]